MSRSKNNAQYMVGIPRGSEMHKFYLAEAQKQGVKVPTYIYQLLKDRYEALHGGGQGIWFPRGTAMPVKQEEPVKPVVASKVNTAIQIFGGEDEDDSPTEPNLRVI